MSQGTLLPTSVAGRGKSFFIADATARMGAVAVQSFFAVAYRQERQQKSGGSFCTLRLADRTGQCEAVIWDDAKPQVGPFAVGEVVKLEFDISTYSGRPQFVIKRLRRAEPHEYLLADFQPHTRHDIDALWDRLVRFVDSFTDPHLQALLRAFLNDAAIADRLRVAPAAKQLHHAWIGGLLEHIVSLLELCDRVCPHYPHLHRDLVLSAAVLHDIGKLDELTWRLTFDYTVEGQMLGHITLGIAMIERKAATVPGFPPRLLLLLEHIVLSHHGRYEYGSPKLPMTPEALLFHQLDDLDAKMFLVRGELDRAAQGKGSGEMTDWIRALERPLLDTQAFLASSDAVADSRPEPTSEERNHALPAED